MSIDLEQQLRAYGSVLDGAVPGAPRSRPWRAQLLVAAVVVIAVGIGALLVVARDDKDRTVVADEVTTTTEVAIPPAPEVVATIPGALLPIRPLAVAGGDVWLDTGKVDGGDRINHRLERRDARTGAVLATVDVPQESVFGIAAANDDEGDVVYLAGGGDGGVPQTSVSAVDVATNTVLFTHTLTEASCSCPIAVGAGAIWLGGNGTDYVLRLDPSTGELVARIELPGPASTLVAVDDRLLVALQGENAFVDIDPETNAIEWHRRAELSDPEPDARIAAFAPASDRGSGHDTLILRTDGKTFVVALPSGIGAWHPFGFAPRAAVDTPRGLLAVGGDRLGIQPESEEPGTEYAYDRESQSFRRVTGGFAPPSVGFEQIVAVDDTLWINDWQREVLVVRL